MRHIQNSRFNAGDDIRQTARRGAAGVDTELILFGGGGFYYGGPAVGGGLGGIILLVLVVLLLTGRLR